MRFASYLWVCLLGAAAFAQTSEPPAAPALSLRQAVGKALQQHPSLKRLDAARQAAEARERVEASLLRPRVSLEAIGKEGPTSAPGFGLSGLVNSTLVRHWGGSVVLSQIIYDFGRALHRTQARHFAADAIHAEEQAQRAFVVLNVYQAYNNALLARRLVDLAEENVATRELTVRQAQVRFDAGLTSRVDVDLARTSLAEARVGLVRARNGLHQAFADLNAAMGAAEPPAYTLEDLPADAPPAAEPSATLEQDVEAALRQRPELEGLEAQIRAVEETARAAQAGGLPLMRGLVTGGYINVPAGQFRQNHIYALGMSVSFPLYTGGQVQAEVADARHQAAALRAGREEQAQTIRLQVTRARLTLTALAQSRQATEEQLRQAQDSVKLATERYREGLGNILEVQQAQLALLTAETNAARLRYETVTAQAVLGYALGTLPSFSDSNTVSDNPVRRP